MYRILIIIILVFSCEPSLEPDTVAPTVVITYPADGATLSKTETVTVDVSEWCFITIYIDNIVVFTVISYPYEYEWDVCVLGTGTHTLMVRAEDRMGNRGQTDVLTFTIDASYDCNSACGGNAVYDCAGVCEGTTQAGDCYLADIDENIYQNVQIGEQLWMAENLKVTHYNNGEAITHITDNDEWGSSNEGQYRVYDNDPLNAYLYGNLYNWAVVNDDRGVCPGSWHVPTLDEYKTLTEYLGGEDVAGGKMKEEGTKHWLSPNTGATNESGFTALPAGNHSSDSMGKYGYFWSSTISLNTFSQAFMWRLHYNLAEVYGAMNDIKGGHSIRCIQD